MYNFNKSSYFCLSLLKISLISFANINLKIHLNITSRLIVENDGIPLSMKKQKFNKKKTYYQFFVLKLCKLV